MRVMLVINNMGRGGAEIQVRDLAIQFAQRGHRVCVVVLMTFEEFADELEAAGVETVALGLSKGKATPAALWGLVSAVRSFKPDVVHSHMFASGMAVRAAAPLLRALRSRPALVHTVHIAFEARRRYAAYRLTNRFCDLFTCVSEEALKNHGAGGAVPTGTGLVVRNGVSLTKFKQQTTTSQEDARRLLGLPAGILWLAVGSFRDEQKDYSTMLRALAAAPAAGNLLIAGVGKLLEEKRTEADRLGISSRVSFLGLRSDVDTLMQAADAYVMSSAWEGLPVVLIEAAASGLPIVCTDVGANAEVVGGIGVLVPPGEPRALGEALGRVASLERSARAELGRQFRARAIERFDLAAVTTEWERLYQRAVQTVSESR